MISKCYVIATAFTVIVFLFLSRKLWIVQPNGPDDIPGQYLIRQVFKPRIKCFAWLTLISLTLALKWQYLGGVLTTFFGALLVANLIYLLAWRKETLRPFRYFTSVFIIMLSASLVMMLIEIDRPNYSALVALANLVLVFLLAMSISIMLKVNIHLWFVAAVLLSLCLDLFTGFRIFRLVQSASLVLALHTIIDEIRESRRCRCLSTRVSFISILAACTALSVWLIT